MPNVILFSSYVLVDNFQRGIFKWPLVFGWSTLSEEYIKKNNMTDTDPIRYCTHTHTLSSSVSVASGSE